MTTMTLLPTPPFSREESCAKFGRLSREFHERAFSHTLTTLSVSLREGRFRALAIIKGTIQASWEKPEPTSLLDLQPALAEAIQQTRFTGKNLTLLVDDPQCLHRTIQVPPMTMDDLVPVLERKVKQEQTWEGAAVWKFRIGIQARGKQTVQLEIWPQRIIDSLVTTCHNLNLQLRHCMPFSTLAESQLRTLPTEPGETTLLITNHGQTISLVAGPNTGPPLVVRQLTRLADGLSIGERVGTEVNRTLMYLNQQLHIGIPRVWLLGENALLSAEQIQPHVASPILPCPIAPDWTFWLCVGANLPIHHFANFTPRDVLQAPIRSVITGVIATMAGIVLCLSVGATAAVTGFLQKHQADVQSIHQTTSLLTQQQEEWKAKLTGIHTQREWAQAVLHSQSMPLEGPLFTYLGTVMPSSLVLHKAGIIRTDQGWVVELAGQSHASLPASLTKLDHLIQRLEQGPYRIQVDPQWRNDLLMQHTSNIGSASDGPRYPFSVKGTIRL